jgi:hypothetical protein
MRIEGVFLAVLAACGGDDEKPPGSGVRDLVATPLASMPTVVEVTWRTDEPSTGAVVFSAAGGPERTTPEQPSDTEHRALLVGLPPQSEVTVRVEAGELGSDEVTATTGAVPGVVPPLRVEGGGNDQFTFTSVMEEARARVVVLDPEGRVVWMHVDERGLSVFRVRPAHDGDGVMYLSSIVRGGPSPESELVRVGWDGVESRVVAVPDLAHDFVELPDGTVVALAYEQRGDVLGNALVEIPPSGEPRTIWTTWDCFDPVAFPGDDPAQGWTHTNALDYDAVNDVFLVGMRNLDAITAVNPSTGACEWTIGGPVGDVDIDGDRFHHAHQFERTADGLLVFDNDGAPGQVSRVLEYALDPEAKTAESVGSIIADPPLFSFILGDIHRLEGGDTMVVWSAASVLDRYDPAGERTFRATGPDGMPFGFAWWTSDPLVP